MNGTSNPSSSSEMPDVEVFLSRPAYPLGGTVVGTILIRQPSSSSSNTTNNSNSTNNNNNNNKIYHHEESNDNNRPSSLREVLSSVVVYVAGFCRIDSRWHNVPEYTKIYGRLHPFLKIQLSSFDPDLLAQGGDETVCFWATNGLELLELSERQEGKWQNLENPNDELLAFTFRVDIPVDLPHSTNATTCRYYYSADVLIKTETKQRVIKTPFSAWTNPHQPLGLPRSQQEKKNVVISGRVKFGTCNGMAHSNGLPCHISATEIHRPKGQMTVAWSRTGNTREDVQTLRVSNANGQPVCVMTVVGASKLTPGSRIHLQWDFPETISSTKAWIPSHQVSACLMGEELAVYEDGTTTRTQSYVFDTCHEWVDPGVTHRVSKTLLLSIDAPCNLYTDVMELSIRCQVDITVRENGEYNNLRMELPCHVVHSFGQEEDIFEDEESQVLSLSELLGVEPDAKDTFHTNDIASDLKILALQMEERLRESKQEGLS
jgi:hypothetical protein